MKGMLHPLRHFDARVPEGDNTTGKRTCAMTVK